MHGNIPEIRGSGRFALPDGPGDVARGGLTGAQDDAGEVGRIDRVRETLGFQRNSFPGFGEIFSRIYLKARGVRRHHQTVP